MNRDDHGDVHDFHAKFGLLPEPGAPRLLTAELLEFRTKFLAEELSEFCESHAAGDLVGAVDALLDLTYVVLGTAVLMGVPWHECWRHVQVANMHKIRAARPEDSKRGSAFDVVKPTGWTGPEAAIAAELRAAGWSDVK